jgi:hypothetical protein
MHYRAWDREAVLIAVPYSDSAILFWPVRRRAAAEISRRAWAASDSELRNVYAGRVFGW